MLRAQLSRRQLYPSHDRAKEIAVPQPHTAPYGSWKSPITSELIVSRTIRLGEVSLDGDDIYSKFVRNGVAKEGQITCGDVTITNATE